jgi:hypothetical protein
MEEKSAFSRKFTAISGHKEAGKDYQQITSPAKWL